MKTRCEMQALRVESGDDSRSEVAEMATLLEEVVATSLGLTQGVLGSTTDTGELWRAFGRNYYAFDLLSDVNARPGAGGAAPASVLLESPIAPLEGSIPCR